MVGERTVEGTCRWPWIFQTSLRDCHIVPSHQHLLSASPTSRNRGAEDYQGIEQAALSWVSSYLLPIRRLHPRATLWCPRVGAEGVPVKHLRAGQILGELFR